MIVTAIQARAKPKEERKQEFFITFVCSMVFLLIFYFVVYFATFFSMREEENKFVAIFDGGYANSDGLVAEICSTESGINEALVTFDNGPIEVPGEISWTHDDGCKITVTTEEVETGTRKSIPIAEAKKQGIAIGAFLYNCSPRYQVDAQYRYIDDETVYQGVAQCGVIKQLGLEQRLFLDPKDPHID